MISAMTLVIEEEVTIADIDEALNHLNLMLKTDQYGDRLTWQKKQLILIFYRGKMLLSILFHIQQEMLS
jgi:hypothetical protein